MSDGRGNQRENGEEEEEYEVIDLREIGNAGWVQRMLGDLSRASVAKQTAVGGITGWATGYVFSKVGRAAAAALGTSLLLIQVASYKGYIRVDWQKVSREVKRARQHIEREANQSIPGVVENVGAFMRENLFIAGGFTGGFLLGLAS